MTQYIIPFENLSMKDVDKVGGKNASLGEMIAHLTQAGIKVPMGFATTAQAYREFLQQNQTDQKIKTTLATLDINNTQLLTQAGAQIRGWIENLPLQPAFIQAITIHYETLNKQGLKNASVAVRSSATAEDLPQASFAGQQETFLNISGIDNVLKAIKTVFASLYQDRAIAYRVHQKLAEDNIALSAGIQQMVRSDLASSGVMFSIDTESGFDQVVLISASYGLGEMVVQGAVDPDEYYVYKPNIKLNKPAIIKRSLGSKNIQLIYGKNGVSVQECQTKKEDRAVFSLSDLEVHLLAKQAIMIEQHYKAPMDIEWAKDGNNGELYILQARPETVKSRESIHVVEQFELINPNKAYTILTMGKSVGQRIGQGPAKILHSAKNIDQIQVGDVLITEMTNPDWEPIMKKAAAIVTNRGGRTCHAAILARELGIPAIVGCADATHHIMNNQEITVSCASGDVGYVYEGILDYKINKHQIDKMPPIPCKIMMNVGDPGSAFNVQRLPNEGIGLARLEFLISNTLKIHPQACLDFDANSPLSDDLKMQIRERIAGYGSATDFYVKKLSEGIATLGAAFAPKKVIIRFSDFKSNEYANLLGGSLYEPREANPMIGFRGASRYVANSFKPCFALECQAIKLVREEMGLTNIEIMIPFVRTLTEAQNLITVLEENGLVRGKNGLRIIMMCEIPSNVLLADQFLEYFDGFSIGSNDLTQLTLGIDRDSALVSTQFDERDPAVKLLLKQAIDACHRANKYIGICGQGPSDHPDLAQWLVEQGIDSLSLNSDTVLSTWLFLS